MDDNTTINDMKKAVQEFCEERDWAQFHNAKDLAIGISTEANELLQIFRFKSLEEVETIIKSKKTDVEDEIADILYFILRFSQMYDIDLSEVMDKKLAKNAEKYPIEKAKGSNKKYNEYN